MTVAFVLVWAVIFQLKHFLADYPLQGKFMLGKFKGGWEWVLPLAAHCSVHAAFTLAIILLFFNPAMWWLAAADFGIHFAMDRIKASKNLMGRWEALSKSEAMRWMSMGDSLCDPDNPVYPCLTEEGMKARKQAFRSNTLFWWCLGVDQLVHHLTHYWILWMLLV